LVLEWDSLSAGERLLVDKKTTKKEWAWYGCGFERQILVSTGNNQSLERVASSVRPEQSCEHLDYLDTEDRLFSTGFLARFNGQPPHSMYGLWQAKLPSPRDGECYDAR
jgi:hypothetical protein